MLVSIKSLDLHEILNGEIVPSDWKGFDSIPRGISDINPNYIESVVKSTLTVCFEKYDLCRITMVSGDKIYADYPSTEELYMNTNLSSGVDLK